MKKTFVFFVSISLIFILSFLIFNLKKVEIAEAGAEHNVYGWAWSNMDDPATPNKDESSVGWISFNSVDCDTDNDGIGNGFMDVACGGDNSTTPSINYGVDIDLDTGILSGYAWSDSIGWITFNSSDFVDVCPSGAGTCEPRINLSNLEISGWARAYAVIGLSAEESGGWDGWIKLSDVTYEIWLNNTVSPVEFRDWAWGSDVIGWLSFNCLEGGNCATADYKVMTSLVINQNPYIESLTVFGANYCLGGGRGQISLEWTYRDYDGNNQEYYWLEVDDGSGWTALGNPPISQTVVPDNNGSSQNILVVSFPNPNNFEVEYNETYNWRVMVEDTEGSQSSWVLGPPITTPSHARPFPDFNPSPLNAFVDEIVDFSDVSKCYLADSTEYDCKMEGALFGTNNVSYAWDFDNNINPGTDDTTEEDTTFTYTAPNIYTAQLEVTDDMGTCFVGKSVFVEEYLPVPKWKEISPF